MRVDIRKSAIKDLKKMSGPDKKRVHDKILDLENFPDVSNMKKLINFEPVYRARTGDYRILFDVFEDHIEVGRVLHRKDSYQKT